MYFRAFGWEFFAETVADQKILLDWHLSKVENEVWCYCWHLSFNPLRITHGHHPTSDGPRDTPGH